MERDEIEDTKCREEQKIQELLVKATPLATFSFRELLNRLSQSCHPACLAWLKRTSKLFSFLFLPPLEGIWDLRVSLCLLTQDPLCT